MSCPNPYILLSFLTKPFLIVNDSSFIPFTYFFFYSLVGKASWHLPIVIKLDNFTIIQITLNLEWNIFAENYCFHPTFHRSETLLVPANAFCNVT